MVQWIWNLTDEKRKQKYCSRAMQYWETFYVHSSFVPFVIYSLFKYWIINYTTKNTTDLLSTHLQCCNRWLLAACRKFLSIFFIFRISFSLDYLWIMISRTRLIVSLDDKINYSYHSTCMDYNRNGIQSFYAFGTFFQTVCKRLIIYTTLRIINRLSSSSWNVKRQRLKQLPIFKTGKNFYPRFELKKVSAMMMANNFERKFGLRRRDSWISTSSHCSIWGKMYLTEEKSCVVKALGENFCTSRSLIRFDVL